MRDLHPLPISSDIKDLPGRNKLLEQISLVLDACIDCPKCVAECAFLKLYGTPKHIAATMIRLTAAVCLLLLNAVCVAFVHLFARWV